MSSPGRLRTAPPLHQTPSESHVATPSEHTNASFPVFDLKFNSAAISSHANDGLSSPTRMSEHTYTINAHSSLSEKSSFRSYRSGSEKSSVVIAPTARAVYEEYAKEQSHTNSRRSLSQKAKGSDRMSYIDAETRPSSENELRKEIEHLREKLRDLQVSQTGAEGTVGDKERIHRLEQELKTQALRYEEMLSKLRAENGRLETLVQNLQSELSHVKSQTATNRSLDMSKETMEHRAQLANLRVRNEELEVQVQTLKSQLEKTESMLHSQQVVMSTHSSHQPIGANSFSIFSPRGEPINPIRNTRPAASLQHSQTRFQTAGSLSEYLSQLISIQTCLEEAWVKDVHMFGQEVNHFEAESSMSMEMTMQKLLQYFGRYDQPAIVKLEQELASAKLEIQSMREKLHLYQSNVVATDAKFTLKSEEVLHLQSSAARTISPTKIDQLSKSTIRVDSTLGQTLAPAHVVQILPPIVQSHDLSAHAHYEQQLRQKDLVIVSLNNRLKEVEAGFSQNVSRLEQELRVQSSHHDSLSSENVSLHNSLEDLKARVAMQSSVISSLEEQLRMEQNHSKSREYEVQRDSHNSDVIQDLKQRLQESEANRLDLNEQLEQSLSVARGMQERIQALTVSLQQKSDEGDTVAEFIGQIDKLQLRSVELENRTRTLARDLENEKYQNESVRQEISQLQAEKDDLTQEYENVMNLYRVSRERNEELEKNLEQLQQAVKAKDSFAETDGQSFLSEDPNQNALRALQLENVDLRDRIQDLEQQLQDLGQQTPVSIFLQQKNEELMTHVLDLQEQLSKANKELALDSSMSPVKSSETAHDLSTNSKQRSFAPSTQESITQKRLQERIDELESLYANAKDEIDHLHEEVQKLDPQALNFAHDEIQSLRQKLGRMVDIEAENLNLKMERKESEEKNLRLNQELARIQQELTSIKKIHNELATEYQELAIRISDSDRSSSEGTKHHDTKSEHGKQSGVVSTTSDESTDKVDGSHEIISTLQRRLAIFEEQSVEKERAIYDLMSEKQSLQMELARISQLLDADHAELRRLSHDLSGDDAKSDSSDETAPLTRSNQLEPHHFRLQQEHNRVLADNERLNHQVENLKMQIQQLMHSREQQVENRPVQNTLYRTLSQPTPSVILEPVLLVHNHVPVQQTVTRVQHVTNVRSDDRTISDLHLIITQKENELRALRERLAVREKEFTLQSDQATRTISDLRSELSIISARFSDISTRFDDEHSRLLQAEGKLRDYEAEVQRLQKVIDELMASQSKSRNLGTEVGVLTAQLNTERFEKQSLLEQLQSKTSEYQLEVESLRIIVSKLELRIQELQGQYEYVIQRESLVKKQYEEAMRSEDSLKELVSSLQKRIQDLGLRLESKDQQIKSLEETVSLLEQKSRGLEIIVESFKKEVVYLISLCNIGGSEQTLPGTENRDTLDLLRDLRGRLEDFTKRYRSLLLQGAEESSQSRRSIGSDQIHLTRAQEDLRRSSLKVQELEKQIDRLSLENKDLILERNRLQSQMSTWKTDLDELRRTKSELQERYSRIEQQFGEERRSYQEAIQHLRLELEDCKAKHYQEISRLRDRLDIVSTENQQIQRQVESTRMKTHQLTSEPARYDTSRHFDGSVTAREYTSRSSFGHLQKESELSPIQHITSRRADMMTTSRYEPSTFAGIAERSTSPRYLSLSSQPPVMSRTESGIRSVSTVAEQSSNRDFAPLPNYLDPYRSTSPGIPSLVRPNDRPSADSFTPRTGTDLSSARGDGKLSAMDAPVADSRPPLSGAGSATELLHTLKRSQTKVVQSYRSSSNGSTTPGRK